MLENARKCSEIYENTNKFYLFPKIIKNHRDRIRIWGPGEYVALALRFRLVLFAFVARANDRFYDFLVNHHPVSITFIDKYAFWYFVKEKYEN